MMPVAVTIDSHVRMHPEEIPAGVLDGIRRPNPDWKSHGVRTVGVPRWYEPWAHDPDDSGRIALERGIGRKVLRDMRRQGIELDITDTRRSVMSNWPALRSGISLRPAQLATVSRALKQRDGLVILPTGSGKTLAALETARASEQSTLVLVPSQILASQWLKSILDFYGMAPGDGRVGRIWGGRTEIGRVITVGIPNSVCRPDRMASLSARIGMVVADEVQRAAATQYHTVVSGLPAGYRIGVSADPRRMDRHEPLIRAVFGDAILHRERKDAESRGSVVPVELRVIRYSTGGNFVRDISERERGLLADASRMEVLDRIVRTATGPVVAFCRTVDGVRELHRRWGAQGLRPGIMIGQANGVRAVEDFKRARRGLSNGSVRLVVATYSAMGVGVDIPELADAVLATPPGQNQRGFLSFNQIRGRVARTSPGKSSGRIWLVWDCNQAPGMATQVAGWNDWLVSTPDQDWTAWAPAGPIDLMP